MCKYLEAIGSQGFHCERTEIKPRMREDVVVRTMVPRMSTLQSLEPVNMLPYAQSRGLCRLNTGIEVWMETLLWVIWVAQSNHLSPYMMRSREGLARERDGPWKSDQVDAVTLALVVEEEPGSQRVWEAFRSWKTQENGFSRRSPEKRMKKKAWPIWLIILTPGFYRKEDLCQSDLQNYRVINLCCSKPVCGNSLWQLQNANTDYDDDDDAMIMTLLI